MWSVVVILCLGHSCAAPIPAFSDARAFEALAPDPIDGRPWRPTCQNIADAYNRMKHIPQQAVCLASAASNLSNP